jgi:hypothetical protein
MTASPPYPVTRHEINTLDRVRCSPLFEKSAVANNNWFYLATGPIPTNAKCGQINGGIDSDALSGVSAVTKDMLSGPFRSTSDYLLDFIDRFSRSGGISDEGQTQLTIQRMEYLVEISHIARG